MSDRLGIDPEVLAAANKALEEFVNQEPTFYNTVGNCRNLQNYLRSENIPLEGWVDVKIFAVAFWACTRPDAKFPLESAPPPKTREEINAAKALRDRFAGSRQGNVSNAADPYVAEEKRKADEAAKFAENLRAEAKAKAEKDAAAEALKSDLSLVPTEQQIVDSHTEGHEDFGKFPLFAELSRTAAASWGLNQLKRYTRNSNSAWFVLEERRQKRIREIQKARQ